MKKNSMADKEIKVSPYSNGKGAKIDVYSPNSRTKPHESIHIQINNETGAGKITEKEIGSPRQETDVKCYLTTACMKHYAEEFDDNCYELRILRWFRDAFVSKEDIAHYYEIAPYIVEAIDDIPECEKIYNYIYENVIDECVKAIEKGNYEFAYKRYKNSILALEQEYDKTVREKTKSKLLSMGTPSFA